MTLREDASRAGCPGWEQKEKFGQVSRSREAMYPSPQTQLYILKQGHGLNDACIYSRLWYRDLKDNSANPTVCDVDDFLDRSTKLPYLLYKFWNATPNTKVNSFGCNKR